LGTIIPRLVIRGLVTVAVNGDPGVAVLVLIVLSSRTTIGVPAGITIGGGGGRVFSSAASEFGTAFAAVAAAPSIGLADADAVSGSGTIAGGAVVSGAGLASAGGSGLVLATG